MTRNVLNVITISKLHNILCAIFFCLFVYILLSIFDSVADLINALDSIYSKCIFLSPYFYSNNFNISCFADNWAVSKSGSFFSSLPFLIIFDMSLICNWLRNWRRFQFDWWHLWLLFRFFKSLYFSSTLIWFKICLFYFWFELSYLLLKLHYFLYKNMITYYFYCNLDLIVTVYFY
jgi:hypothetical protein